MSDLTDASGTLTMVTTTAPISAPDVTVTLGRAGTDATDVLVPAFGSSGIGIRPVARDTSPFLSAADDQNISSLLAGTAWNGTAITYSFPTSGSLYGTQASYGDPAPFNGFSPLDSAGHSNQVAEVQRAFSLLASYTALTFTQITETSVDHATIRLANSSSPQTSYAYNPSTSPHGGDVFYGGTGKNPVMGNFDSGQATLHEIGHALGLEHGQLNPGVDPDTYGGMNADRLDIEFSLMNYPNYIGEPLNRGGTATTSPQTYMMYDIAAFQDMYGANYSLAGTNQTYSWSPTTGTEFINGVSQGLPYDGHIFETIWTEGSNSTYDLSNFSQGQVDDMNPGGWMRFSNAQLADLDFTSSDPARIARGDIYNALEFNGDTRSLIDNIITGAGNDTIIGNAADNVIRAGAGNDTIDGGAGIDSAIFSGQRSAYTLMALSGTGVRVAGPDGFDTLTNVEKLVFDDQTVNWSQTLASRVTHNFDGDGHADLLWQNDDGTPAAWLLNGTSLVAGANIGFNPGPSWHTKDLGDFNGDGKADVLWQNDDGTPAVWLMNGLNIQSGANVGFNPGPAWHVIAAADFDGDGKADILWQNADGTPAIWLMNGTDLIAGASLFNPGPSWHVIGAGDFDGDGKADILWQNSSGQAAIWLMNGLSLVSGANEGVNNGPAWQIQATADFNGDGKADVLFQNTNGQPALWLMNGRTIVSSSIVGFNPGAAWQIHGAADFNGDGNADIEWQNTDGTPAVWLMNGLQLLSGSNVGFDPGTSWHLTPGHDALV
jgi:serralysin